VVRFIPRRERWSRRATRRRWWRRHWLSADRACIYQKRPRGSRADRSYDEQIVLARHARRGQRGTLDFTHGSSLARSAESLSALSDLSSPFSALAAFWSAVAIAPETRRRLTRPRQARSERSVCRRQLQLGEKRGSAIGTTRRGNGSKIMAISDGHGLPLAVHVASASPHETKLVETTIEQRFFADLPERLIGDRAYDSDRLDERLMKHYGIEMISPHTSKRTRTLTQDGRVLRRYRRRWKVERLFAWLHNYRRIVVRWERYPKNFLGMVHLASAIIF
jgi:transposase